MDNSKFVSERNKLLKVKEEAEKNFRLAVRWLMEANAFGNTFRDGEHWKGGHWVELADVAREAREEAIHDLLAKRRVLDRAIESLEDFDRRAKED